MRVVLTLSAMLMTCVSEIVAEDPKPPNVILIVADTLRADHLSCYGYDRPTSPELDKLALQSAVFHHAISTAPYTLPSHASMFTGQLPMMHMAQTYINSDGFKHQRGELVHRPLAEEFVTLAEAFQEIGYRTAGFAANTVFLDSRTGLAQGFQEYFNERLGVRMLNEQIVPWVAKHREEPFFLFINYMDTHKPYNTKRVDGFMEHVEGLKSVPLLRGLYPTVMMQKQASPEQLQTQKDVYDLAIRNLDRGIGELMGELRELGQYDNSLIIFTSDHGEFLGEHDYLTHWKDVYEEVVHVPLIMKYPGQHVKLRMAQTTSTVQIPHMIVNALKGSKLEGYREQFETKLGAGMLVVESRFSHDKDYYNRKWGHRFKRVRFAIYEGPHKYIHSTNGEHALFDLEADPNELRNILEQKSSVADAMRVNLESLLESAPTPKMVTDDSMPAIEAEELKELKDLGYL